MSKVIVIDSGHGGHDSGASANGLREKNLTLDIAKRLHTKLNKLDGVKAIMTRTSDEFLSLTERTNIANRNNADVFVSIHINSGGGTGFETFIYSGNVSNNTKVLQNNVHEEVMKQIGGNYRGTATQNIQLLKKLRE